MTADEISSRERLWIPLVAPILWSLHFTLCYVTVAVWCGRFAGETTVGLRPLIAAYTIVALAGMGALFLLGLRRHRYQLPTRTHDDDTPEDRTHFIAFTTMLLSGLSIVATLYAALAIVLVEGCG